MRPCDTVWKRTNLDLDPLRLGDLETERDLEGDLDGERDTAERPDPLPDTTDPSESDILTAGVTLPTRRRPTDTAQNLYVERTSQIELDYFEAASFSVL